MWRKSKYRVPVGPESRGFRHFKRFRPRDACETMERHAFRHLEVALRRGERSFRTMSDGSIFEHKAPSFRWPLERVA